MKRIWFGMLCLLAPMLTSTAASGQQQDPADIIAIEASDARMNAVIAEAKAGFPDFLAAYRSGQFDRDSFVFKYPLGGWEHIWVDFDRLDGGALIGHLANVPEQPGFKQGQEVSVPIADISDWAYRDANGVMVGHRTTRVLLERMDEETRRSVIDYMGW